MDIYSVFQGSFVHGNNLDCVNDTMPLTALLVGTLGGAASSLRGGAANWTEDSSGLPTQSTARILNSAGAFVFPVPAKNLTYPYSASAFPDSLSALTWANLPTVNSSALAGTPDQFPQKLFVGLFLSICLFQIRRRRTSCCAACAGLSGIYPLGNLIYIIADQNIGAKGAR